MVMCGHLCGHLYLSVECAACTLNKPLVVLFTNKGSDGHFCLFRMCHEVSIKICMGETYEFKTSHILIPHLGEGRGSRSLYHPSKPLMSLSPHLEMRRLCSGPNIMPGVV